jgi:hypothetical protein
MENLAQIARKTANHVHLLVLLLLLANRKIALARLVIRAPICALLRRVVSIRQMGMITVLAGLDIELTG